jgi:hypothetical protein
MGPAPWEGKDQKSGAEEDPVEERTIKDGDSKISCFLMLASPHPSGTQRYYSHSTDGETERVRAMFFSHTVKPGL